MSEQPGSSTPTSVLLVDDSAAMRQLLRMTLDGQAGWEVAGEVSDGAQALAFAGRRCPDAIVLDQEMPGMSGLQALPRLRAACPRARIVMWSSDDDAQDLAIESGADVFISKSAPLADLLAALRAGAAERRTGRALPRAEPGRLVLTLPEHRIVPGATIVYDADDGRARTVVLPADAAPGTTVPVASGQQGARLMLLVAG